MIKVEIRTYAHTYDLALENLCGMFDWSNLKSFPKFAASSSTKNILIANPSTENGITYDIISNAWRATSCAIQDTMLDSM